MNQGYLAAITTPERPAHHQLSKLPTDLLALVLSLLDMNAQLTGDTPFLPSLFSRCL
jgi:hypothetical protein